MTTAERNEILSIAFSRLSQLGSGLSDIEPCDNGVSFVQTWKDYCRGCYQGKWSTRLSITWDELMDEDNVYIPELVKKRWDAAMQAEMKAQRLTNKYYLLS